MPVTRSGNETDPSTPIPRRSRQRKTASDNSATARDEASTPTPVPKTQNNAENTTSEESTMMQAEPTTGDRQIEERPHEQEVAGNVEGGHLPTNSESTTQAKDTTQEIVRTDVSGQEENPDSEQTPKSKIPFREEARGRAVSLTPATPQKPENRLVPIFQR
ncbi:hypothetical protein KEM55_008199, partial [Ascosphaera atra]